MTATSALVTMGDQIRPRIAECDREFGAHDVFLLIQFTSTTSIDLLGDPKLWAQDATQLALQVRTTVDCVKFLLSNIHPT